MENTLIIDNETKKLLNTTDFRQQVKKRSDSLINYFLPSYFLVGLVFASFYDTWYVAFCVGGLSLVAYYSVKILLPDSNLYQYVLGVILGIYMAQFIYQMHGQFEMHFFAFIGSAILITYQNWKLQIPMLAVVVVHHIIFGYLQNTGVTDIYFTQLDSFELQAFITHFLLAAVIFFICGLWAYQLKKSSEVQLEQAITMARLQQESLVAATILQHEIEREASRQALADSNLRFTYAAQATSEAIWDRNYTDNNILWGDGYSTLFGYAITPETASVSFWKSKVHPEDLQLIISIIQEAKENPNGKGWSYEYRFLKAGGEYAYVRERAIILRDEKGVVCRSIGALQDITESKQHEILFKELNRQLEQEKYFLDALMDNMTDAIYFKDKESRFLRVSKFMAGKFGTTTEGLIGKSDLDFHTAAHAAKAYGDEQNIQRTRTAKIDYIENIKKENGEQRWLSSTKMPLLNSHDEVVGTFGMSRDITHLKKLEAEQQEAKMEKAVAQGKFEIASDVMHDIGNAVVGFGSYLTRIRRLQEQDNPEQLQQLIRFFEEQQAAMTVALGESKAGAVIKLLSGIVQTQQNSQQEINRSITEQLNIITNIQEILDIQRQYIAGHTSQERKPVNLREIIHDSLAMVAASIEKNGIIVSVHIPAEPPLLKGDRTKLMQVILNLLKNSIEAIDIATEEKTIFIHLTATATNLVLKIKDSGKGFDNALAVQFFKNGFTTKAAGSGMGLYNCRTIVESHEGTVAISSEGPGKGALAEISFIIDSDQKN